MCGIVGSLGLELSPAAFDAAVDALSHRGPDGHGTWSDPQHGVLLGHTRLAIIDLSPAGAQPMQSADGRWVLTYNGEIYNFAKIRQRLSAGGHRFNGDSDTEVFVEAIAAWGLADTLAEVDGMFAFGLWDRQNATLTLGRDRMGEKPLYCGTVGSGFAFASELSSIKALPSFDASINRDAIALLLRNKYIPAPFSIYEGIQKLPAAHTVTITADGMGAPKPYWSLHDHLPDPGAGSPNPAQTVEAFTELLVDTVHDRMVADVPLGAFLSGGVDSSLVAAAMVATGAEVNTFTIGLSEGGFDESGHARAVAKHLGTNHTELTVTADMALAVVPELPRIYSEPFADSSQIPTYLVSKMAREHVTVALSGDGGDELFGGYNRYVWGPRMLSRLGKAPGSVRSAAASVLAAIPAGVFDTAASLIPASKRPRLAGMKVHKAAGALGATNDIAMLRQLTTHWEDPASVVLGATEPRNLLTDPAAWPDGLDPALRMMTVDALTYLPDDIMAKVDRAAMAVSLETRAPLLATPLVEFAAGLPLDMRIRDGQTKWLLRSALDKWVPRQLVDRPKAGFGIPIHSWLRGPLQGWASDLLDPGLLSSDGYFDCEPIQALWQTHLGGTDGGEFKLWDVLMFQAWLHDGQGART